MGQNSFTAALTDRRGDAIWPERLTDKPPLLGRPTLRWLCVACLAVIVYGTLGPLGLRHGPWLAPNSQWSWALVWRPSDFNDTYTNFVVYVPVGLSLRLLVRRRGRAGAPDFLIGLSLSLALSYFTEVVQQFMPARSSNLRDVAVNGVAALLGCLSAPTVQRVARLAHRAAFQARRRNVWALLACSAALTTGALMLLPLRPSRPHFDLSLIRALDFEDLRCFGMFAFLGFCLGAAALQRRPGLAAALTALLLVLLLAAGLELAQAFSARHSAGLLDMLIAALGGAIGCAGAARGALLGDLNADGRVAQRPTADPTRSALQGLALAGGIVGALAIQLHRVAWSSVAAPGHLVVRWIPMQVYFAQPFHRVLSDLVETLLIYGLLTILALLCGRRRSRPLALLLVLSLATLGELFHLLFGRGVADVTSPLLAVVAWVLALRLWTVMIPRSASQPPVLPSPRAQSMAPPVA